MKKTLLIIVLFLSVQNLFSQQDSLLKKFKYRIDHYQAANFTIGANTQFYKENPMVTNNSKSSSTSGTLGAG